MPPKTRLAAKKTRATNRLASKKPRAAKKQVKAPKPSSKKRKSNTPSTTESFPAEGDEPTELPVPPPAEHPAAEHPPPPGDRTAEPLFMGDPPTSPICVNCLMHHMNQVREDCDRIGEAMYTHVSESHDGLYSGIAELRGGMKELKEDLDEKLQMVYDHMDEIFRQINDLNKDRSK